MSTKPRNIARVAITPLLAVSCIIMIMATIGCGDGKASADKSTNTKSASSVRGDDKASDSTSNTSRITAPTRTSNKDATGQANHNQPTVDQPWPAPKDREAIFLDFTMTNQDGKPLNLQDIINKPTVATFVFTGCDNAAMCPMQAAKVGYMQDAARKAGLDKNVQFLILSFDPDKDTPKVLKQFVEKQGVEFDNALALTPDKKQFAEFLQELGLRVSYGEDGKINHQTDLMIFDADGKRVRWYGGEWNNKIVVSELKRLVSEKE